MNTKELRELCEREGVTDLAPFNQVHRDNLWVLVFSTIPVTDTERFLHTYTEMAHLCRAVRYSKKDK